MARNYLKYMHIEFAVSQKLGLMFRPDDVLPQNIKSWAINQIYTPSPALGISSANSKVNKWPVSLNPELDERAIKFSQFRQLEKNATSKDRRYDVVIALRAVETLDFMTARWARLSYDFLDHASNRIMNEISRVSRVVYDISGKPPSTIEWE
tara:strand:+ start:905 stop:1360 length:456 start_codon:yes stop_codon:yes gene_type:complete